MRIEVGYGLEARLTDARSRQILDDIVRPQFRAGNYAAGIEAGLDGIASVIQGAPLPAPRRQLGSQIGSIVGILFFAFMFLSVVGTFSVVALLTPGTPGWFLYLFLAPFYAIFPSVIFPPYGGVVMGAAWLILFPILRSLINTPPARSSAGAWLVITPSSAEGLEGRRIPGGGGGGRRAAALLGRRRPSSWSPRTRRRGRGRPRQSSALASPLTGAFRDDRALLSRGPDFFGFRHRCPETASASAAACPPSRFLL